MKILRIILGIIVMLGSLVACTSNEINPNMHIHKAKLTEKEKNIASLMGNNLGHAIFDFNTDKTVKSIQFNIYKLNNDKWELVSGGSDAFDGSKGRLGLSFSNIAKGICTGIQSQNTNGSVTQTLLPMDDFTNMSSAMQTLNKDIKIEYEKEIPLVIQVFTSKEKISPNSVEDFNHPEAYQKLGYDHVYAITVTFSQKELK
ncbi:MAG: hypothetical protein AB9856_02205 [Cellulosilyticaceae bacterium]